MARSDVDENRGTRETFMDRDWSEITDGTAQDDRLPPPLREGYINADERTFHDMLSRTAEFAKSVRYYNLTNHLDGSWEKLFSTDEAVVMAEIVATDPTRMESEFREIETESRTGGAASYLLHFALRIDGWYRRLQNTETETGQVMGHHVKAVVDRRLKDLLREVGHIPTQGDSGEGIVGSNSVLTSRFHPIWEMSAETGGSAGYSVRTEGDTKELFRNTFYSLVSAVSYLKPVARDRMENSLTNGKHDPAMALFIAFAKLFATAQKKVNLFTIRHRDFYYEDVLRMKPQQQTLDSTLLLLEAELGSTSLSVPQGTDFIAGKTGDGALIYRSETALNVTDAQVRSVMTLRSPRDRQISPEWELHYVNGLGTTTIFPPAPGVPDTTSWPLFGADHPPVETDPSRVSFPGFAVASPVLLLREGKRTIRATIVYTIPDPPRPTEDGITHKDVPFAKEIAFGQRFRKLILNAYPANPSQEELQKLKEEEEGFRAQARDDFQFEAKNDLLVQARLDMFYRVAGTAFIPAVTVAKGWYQAPDYTLSPPVAGAAGRCELTFTITLGPEVPPVTACDPAVHGSGYGTELPVLRFVVNPGADIYPYSLFRDLLVEEIAIQSDVSGVTNIVAWNQYGQLDTSKPFQPFGPLPTLNSYLILGNYESSGMNLTRLELDIEWGDLPDLPDGFTDYYKGYPTSYPNDSFVISVSALRDGSWRPDSTDGLVTATLFESASEGGKVAKQRHMPLNIVRWFKCRDRILSEQNFRYDQRARNGFLRIAFTGPDAAFGHKDYPSVLTNVLSGNATTRWWHRRDESPLPNAPYTPVINRLSLSWSAKTVLAAGSQAIDNGGPLNERVYLLHPFGIVTVDTDKRWTMLPGIAPEDANKQGAVPPAADFDGNLFIGFSASEPGGVLTLVFHLREDSAQVVSTDREHVFWSYLSSDQWKPFPEMRLRSDTTDGFLSSGIVTLDVPSDINQNNTLMPGKLYWLRVSARRNFNLFCSLYAVRAQGVVVKRVLTEKGPAVTSRPLPPGSIRGPVVSIPGLRSVSQPLASWGGEEPETKPQTIARTAERLRHKYRASTPFDFERLVLENFPEVFKVKCFSAMTSEGGMKPKPGCVLVVVVPQQTESERGVVFDPMLDAVQLGRIMTFLNGLTSEFARIEVRNPVYERVQLRCTVKLTEDAARQRGIYLKEINRRVVEYFSPWSPVGPPPRFGWSFRNDEAEAFVRSLPYVEFVTKFSLLHITRDEKGAYRLGDTARRESMDMQSGLPDEGSLKISPRYPWSLAIPTQNHFIETIDKRGVAMAEPGEITGVGRMEIGSTFITFRRRR
jgi:hypothetical protein